MEALPRCPDCDEPLRPWRSCTRICRRADGKKQYLLIQILHCDQCHHSHRLLPNCLVPYKHYDAASIEAGIQDGLTAAVAADESTIHRWIQWYREWSVYVNGMLDALHQRGVFSESVTPSRALAAILRDLGRWVGDAPGWLARAVYPVVCNRYWQCFPA